MTRRTHTTTLKANRTHIVSRETLLNTVMSDQCRQVCFTSLQQDGSIHSFAAPKRTVRDLIKLVNKRATFCIRLVKYAKRYTLHIG